MQPGASTSTILDRSHSSAQWHHNSVADDSSGGMTANEFHQFLRDQKQKRNSLAYSQNSMYYSNTAGSMGQFQTSGLQLSPLRKKKRDALRNEIISQTQVRKKVSTCKKPATSSQKSRLQLNQSNQKQSSLDESVPSN